MWRVIDEPGVAAERITADAGRGTASFVVVPRTHPAGSLRPPLRGCSATAGDPGLRSPGREDEGAAPRDGAQTAPP